MEPIKSSATHGELIEDRIRQIVREEIAAQFRRLSETSPVVGNQGINLDEVLKDDICHLVKS
jgi:hypothetical protein